MRHQTVVLSTLLVFSIAVSRTAVAADDSAKVIVSAEAFTYAQLIAQGAEPMKYPEDCCSLIHNPGTPKDAYHFELADASFVRIKVDALKFAPILFKMSCPNRGFFTTTTECSAEELKEKVDAALSVDYSSSLYGKYRAKWVAVRDGVKLPENSKWGGQEIYSFKRANGVDELVLGPINGLPTSVSLSGFAEKAVTLIPPSK